VTWVVARPAGTVTFLFTDIEGSTRRWEQDPEVMAADLAAVAQWTGGVRQVRAKVSAALLSNS
jgi:hypothetical protein